jgi:hypothetical protein
MDTYSNKGYQQITALNTATLLTVPTGSTLAVIEAEAQQVRWRDDGTNPTASVGHVLNPGDVLVYRGNLSGIRFIEVAASAKLSVSYYN